MNKKLLSVIGISGALMFGSVYSISANTSGYDLYKDALKKTHELQSTTMDVQFQLEDNGKDLLISNTQMKTNSETELMNGKATMTNGKETSKVEMFRQDGQWFLQQAGESKLYKMDSSKRKHSNMGERRHELQEDLERLVDVLTKNLQQKIVVNENGKGYKSVTLELSKSEIPLAANVVSSLVVKHAAMMNDYEGTNKSDFKHIKPSLPELKEEIRIHSIEISADIHPENYIETQVVKASVSGKDASGVQHILEIKFEIELSNVNETSIKPIDISNREIIEVKHGR